MAIILGFYNPQCIEDIFASPSIANYDLTDFTSKKNNVLYFDTIDSDLYKAGVCFYAMKQTTGWLIAIVGKATSMVPGTWEINVLELPMPTLDIFLDKKMKDIVGRIIGDKLLVDLVKIDYSQQSGILEIGKDKRIRIAYDQGKIVGGEKIERISELYLASLGVADADVLEIAAKIASVIPLYVETESKYRRGLCLAGLMVEESEAIVDWESAQNGLNALLTKQIEQIFAAQKKFMRDFSDPETLHQLRVQIRRLRAYVQLAGAVLNNEGYLQWKGYFRTWGQSMNLLRDTDVLIGLCREAASFIDVDGEKTNPLQTVLQTNRQEEIEKVKADLLSGKSTTMLLQFTLWLSKEAFIPSAQKMEFKEFTNKRLRKWIGRMQEMGKDIDTKTMAELHQLRIIGKKVRYVLEGVKRDNNSQSLKDLKLIQDDLGNIHDAAVQAAMLGRLLSNHADTSMHRHIGILIGWTARMKYESQQKLDKDWAHFCYNIKLGQKYVEK